jgi:O-antigen/teichoic acid export membrane protein
MASDGEEISLHQKIIRATAWLSASAFVARLAGLLVTFSLISLLSLKEYGVYKLAVATFGFFAAFFVSGFDALVINDLAVERGRGRHDRVKRLFLEYGIFKIAVGSLLFFLSLLGAFFFHRFFDADILPLIPLLSFLFLFMALERGINLLLNLYVEFRLISLFTVLEEAVKLVAVLLFVGFFQYGARGAILADVVSTGIAVFVFLPHASGFLKKTLSFTAAKGSLLWEIIRGHGKWAIYSRYLGDAKNSLRPWLLNTFVGAEAVGIYAFAESLYAQVVSLLPLSNVLIPILPLHIEDRSALRTLLVKGIKYGTPIFAAVGIISFFAIPEIIRFFFPRYEASVPIFSIIIPSIVTSAAAFILTSILYAQRQQKAQFFITLASVGVMASLGLLLVVPFGAIGIAIEFVLTTFFYGIVRLWYVFAVYPELRFRPLALFQWRREDGEFFRSLISGAALRLRSGISLSEAPRERRSLPRGK